MPASDWVVSSSRRSRSTHRSATSWAATRASSPSSTRRAVDGCAARAGLARAGNVNPSLVCTGPLTYVGGEATRLDIANLKQAVDGLDVEAFLPAVAPGTIEHWLFNEHYKDDEELLFAIADAMHEEYKLITDSGLNIQIDDPDLPDGWQMFPEMSVEEYRRYANRARRGAQSRAEGHSHRADTTAYMLGQRPRAAQERHPTRSYRRHRVEGQGAGVFDRSRQPAPRPRVASVAGRAVARGHVADAGRHWPRDRHRRAPAPGGRSARPLRRAGGQRERHRRYRLRGRLPRLERRNCLGEVRGHG